MVKARITYVLSVIDMVVWSTFAEAAPSDQKTNEMAGHY